MAETQLLISGRTQFADPAPVDGSVAPLSFTAAGRLRVDPTAAAVSGITQVNEVANLDGVLAALSLTAKGRLRTEALPKQFASSSADLAAVSSVLIIDVSETANLAFHVKNTGTATMAAGAFAFEGSLDSTNGTDGTWFAIQAARSDSNTIDKTVTLSLAAGVGMAYGWDASVNSLKWFRVRCTTAVTASSIATWTALRSSYPTEPTPALASVGITGSVAVSSIGTVVTTTPTNANTVLALTGAATTNATILRSASCNLFELSVFNPTAATVYVKLYNKATAPTVGTDIPTHTIPVAASAQVSLEFGAIGKRFTAGIGIAITAAAVATDTTVVAAGVQVSGTTI